LPRLAFLSLKKNQSSFRINAKGDAHDIQSGHGLGFPC
jgi:hypothetical protein